MHLFDANEHLRKFNTVSEIVEEYYGVRLDFYDKRKTFQIDTLEKELVLLSNKARFINDNLSGKIDLRRKKKDEIIEILEKLGYNPIGGDTPLTLLKFDSENNKEGISGNISGGLPHTNYNYLIKMPMDSVTEEAVEKLMKEKGEKEAELDLLTKLSIKKMWLNELSELKREYLKFIGKEDKKKTESKPVTIKIKKK
jgi:DNA topoisomerase-2